MEAISMMELLKQVAEVLTKAGIPSEAKVGRSNTHGVLYVAECKVDVYRNYRETLNILGYKFRYNKNGWRADQIVQLLVQSLPALLESKQRMQTREEKQKLIAELQEQHPTLELLLHGDGRYTVTLRSDDFTLIAIAADKLEEMEYVSDRTVAAPTNGPPRYCLVDDDNKPFADRTLRELTALLTDDQLDILLTIPPGGLYVVDETRIMRLT